MADDDPTQIRQARQVLAARDTLNGRFMLWVGVFMAAIVGAAATGVEPLIFSTIGIYAAGAGAFAWRTTQNRSEVNRSKALVEAWESQSVLDQIAATDPIPDDPRWEALSNVLARVRQLGDDHAREVADTAEGRLKAWMRDLASLQEALEAEKALGGESPRGERLLVAQQAKQAQFDRLVEGLRDLHVELAVREASSVDPLVDRIEDLLAVAEAETEVEALSQEEERLRLERAAGTRQRT